MDHDTGMGQGKPFALGSGCQEDGGHRGCHADANGRNIGTDVLHGVINGQSSTHTAARAIDVEMDILIRIFRFEKERSWATIRLAI